MLARLVESTTTHGTDECSVGLGTRTLRDADDFVDLEAELPLRVRSAVLDGEPHILLQARAIHGLQVKMLEVEVFNILRADFMREDQLELASAPLPEGAVGLRTDGEPIDAGERQHRAIGLYGYFETAAVAGLD